MRAPATAPVPAAMRHIVEVRGFDFSPAHLEVRRGDTVTWINRDMVPHTATDSLGGWGSGELPAGARGSWIAKETGRFGYLCTYHPSMRGTVVVSGAR